MKNAYAVFRLSSKRKQVFLNIFESHFQIFKIRFYNKLFFEQNARVPLAVSVRLKHFVPLENTRKSLVFCYFQGYKMATLAINELKVYKGILFSSKNNLLFSFQICWKPENWKQRHSFLSGPRVRFFFSNMFSTIWSEFKGKVIFEL